MFRKRSDIAAWLVGLIEAFAADAAENDLSLGRREPAFDKPLVGFARGDDPIWDLYVSHIGDFYLTPASVFSRAFPDSAAGAGELVVVSWVLPSTARVRKEQGKRKKQPSQRWAHVRFYGERFNEALRRHVVERLSAEGIAAVAPMLEPFWARSEKGPYAPCSNWSERHAAYAAGLGTFGLCDGLITPVGKAMRTGSVVARVDIPPSPRPYTDPHAYCLFYSHGTCGKCIPRCPVGAISGKGHDKQACMRYTEAAMKAYSKRRYGVDIPVCGLCQVQVPCMDHIPGPEEG